MLKQSVATLTEVYVRKYNKETPKTNTKAFLFDNICAVLTTICVIIMFCGIVQEYFPRVSWAVHLLEKHSGSTPWLCHLARDIISALINVYV